MTRCLLLALNVTFQVTLGFFFVINSTVANNLPLKSNDIFRIEFPSGVQYTSAFLEGETSTLLYSSWDGYQVEKSEFKYIDLIIDGNKITFTSPNTIKNKQKERIRTNASKVTIKGVDWFYFIEADHWNSTAIAYRANWIKGELTNKQKINTSRPLSPSSNPIWYSLNKEGVALVNIIKGCCKLFYSSSEDGITFDDAIDIKNTGFMPALASFPNNNLLYVFQKSFRTSMLKPNGKPNFVKKTHFKISNDKGNIWGKLTPISKTDITVHDAKPVQRNDENLDIYYAYPREGTSEMSLWRKCVTPDGVLGEEELVIDHAFGNIAKPTPHRLNNGKLLLTFVEQGKVVLKGDHNIHAAIISSNAKCPEVIS